MCYRDVMDFDEDSLFAVAAKAPTSLADRFVVPPFSVLDRRAGYWMDRRRQWLSMGIQSEVGRDGDLLNMSGSLANSNPDFAMFDNMKNISVFDPVICELAYRWFAKPGAAILDPFSGGSVRGVVASHHACHYTGIDIRKEQVAANYEQVGICGAPTPNWLIGDATRMGNVIADDERFDLVFSCPPYGDLEVYSDDPRDISSWGWNEFRSGHRQAIADACKRLHNNRYAVWVIGDIRDTNGNYRGLHHETANAFRAEGLTILNECIIVDPVGTAAVRASRPFEANRRIVNTHQYMMVFLKGDAGKAARWAQTYTPSIAEQPLVSVDPQVYEGEEEIVPLW